jgi:hypothetical protein
MQLHDHLSRGRSANRARRTGQVRAGPAAPSARHLFLLLDGVSLQPCGGIQRTAVSQQYHNQEEKRSNAVILIAASLIAAVRLPIP